MSLAMTVDERTAFLADLHVGVLAVVETSGAPLAAPLWYAYRQGGDVRMWVDSSSRKAVALRASGRACLCVQTEDAPYKYVSVEGPVVLSDGYDREEFRSVAVKYLGPELGEMYAASSEEGMAHTVTVSLAPDRWYTIDYNKQFS